MTSLYGRVGWSQLLVSVAVTVLVMLKRGCSVFWSVIKAEWDIFVVINICSHLQLITTIIIIIITITTFI